MVAKIIYIKKGPSNHALVDAFKYAYDENNRHIALFTTEAGDLIGLRIVGLEHEDGTGKSISYVGYIRYIMFEHGAPSGLYIGCKVHGWQKPTAKRCWMAPDEPAPTPTLPRNRR